MTSETEDFFDLSALEAGLLPRASGDAGPPSPPDLLLRIQDFYRTMKSEQPHQPDIYQPAGEWQAHIERRMPHYGRLHRQLHPQSRTPPG